ncbi:MAG: aminotransferase class V-fold PLP-dependent enzyme [Halodesulfurarchaeum sp.]
MSLSVADLRADIPALSEASYLNWGATGPSPDRVTAAIRDHHRTQEVDAHANGNVYPTNMDLFEAARDRAAEFLGAASEEIALTASTSDGINRVASALDWSEGDVVVTTDFEHPAGILPWQRLARHRDVETRVLSSEQGVISDAELQRSLDGAKLLCLSAIDWKFGRKHPVADIVEKAHEKDVRVLVDAVQVPGQMPLDVTDWGADFVATAGHKWLMGPWGAGMLYVDADVANGLEPAHIGYRGVTEPNGDEYELKAGAPRFEVGTTNPATYAGLMAAMDTIEDVGLETVATEIERLTDRFKAEVPADRLRSPEAYHTGLVSVSVGDPEGVVDQLAARDIQIRALPMPETVRLSFHAFNTAEEVDAAVEALAETWDSTTR